MTAPMGAPVPDYVGEEVQIGSGFGGMKPLAQHGRIVIAQGALTLYGTKGDVIDSAPLDQVQLKKSKVTIGQGAVAQMNGKKYFIAVGHGANLGDPDAEAVAQVASAISATHGFIKAFELAAGRST
ncbi:MAG: hypothetical protein FWD29_09160 [Micrococcales bacterium]|nr:hypothetical protein [Micrococcales bacterium]